MAAKSRKSSGKARSGRAAAATKAAKATKAAQAGKAARANGKGGNGKALTVPAKGDAARGRYSLVTLRNEFDRIVEELSSSIPLLPFRGRAVELEPFRRLQSALALTMPAVDVVERSREYKITAELPGMERKDIALTVSDDVITIKGEKKTEEKRQSKNVHLAERRYGAFERSFRLPDGASSDGIDASFRQGVLTITLPKNADVRSRERKISVRAS